MSVARILTPQPHESGVGATMIAGALAECSGDHGGGCAMECVYEVMLQRPQLFPLDLAVRAVERALWLGELVTEGGRITQGKFPYRRSQAPRAVLTHLD